MMPENRVDRKFSSLRPGSPETIAERIEAGLARTIEAETRTKRSKPFSGLRRSGHVRSRAQGSEDVREAWRGSARAQGSAVPGREGREGFEDVLSLSEPFSRPDMS